MRGPDPCIHQRKVDLAKCDGSPDRVRRRQRLFSKCAHGRCHFFFFWYIASMRWVTRKPPKILTEAKISATKPKPRAQAPPLPTIATPTASSAPTTITEEIALVTDISGVCSAGVTDHTTK